MTDRLIAAAEGQRIPPPSELGAAARDLDYHVRFWRERARVHVNLAPADHVSAAARIKFALRTVRRAHIQRHPTDRKQLLTWAITGFP